MSALLHGTGSSDVAGSGEAGRAAATAAVSGLAGARPGLVLVWASVRYDLPALLAGIAAVTGEGPVVGATSTGHFVGGTLSRPGTGVVVLALAGGEHRFGTAAVRGMGSRPGDAGTEVARAARAASGDHGLPHAALLLLADGLVGGQQEVLAGAHRAAGASVPVFGGMAGDDWRLSSTSVFRGGEVLEDAVVGVWIASPRPLHVVSAHGWTPVGPPQLVTRAEGKVVHEIGGRPAAEVYAGTIDVEEAARRGPRFGEAVPESVYALGIIEPDGSHLVRSVHVAADGTLETFEPVPTFAAVQLMGADPAALLQVADHVAREALTGEDTVLLTFDCAARQTVLGEAVEDEVARLQSAAGAVTCFGFYSYGEFARSRGVGGVHNATLTALAL